MSADIVPLHQEEKPDPRVWTCAFCSCRTFYLYEDDSTECAMCGYHDPNPEGQWKERLRPDPTLDPNVVTRDIVPFGVASLARASVVKSIDDEAVAVAVLWPSGRIRLWSVFDHNDSPKRKSWLRKMLGITAGLALGDKSRDAGDLPDPE